MYCIFLLGTNGSNMTLKLSKTIVEVHFPAILRRTLLAAPEVVGDAAE